MSVVYRIEKGIFLPPEIKSERKKREYKKRQVGVTRAEAQPDGYPFSSCQVGDSFFFEDVSIVGRSWYWGKKLSMKFTSRKEGNGRRMWRIA